MKVSWPCFHCWHSLWTGYRVSRVENHRGFGNMEFKSTHEVKKCCKCEKIVHLDGYWKPRRIKNCDCGH